MQESGVPRHQIWVTTKLWPNGRDRPTVRAALLSSLKKLGTDYVDLYLIHSPNDLDNRIGQWLELEGIFGL